jgi:hypothetical protein
MRLRALNHNGIERFRSALGPLRQGASPELPTALLEDPAHTEDVSVDIDLTARTFTSRLQLGEYLNEALEPLQADEIERNRGLWTWLSLWLFDVVCPKRADGTRRPGRDYRHIPDFGYRHRHRHLLLGPYEVYRRHGARTVALLTGPPHSESRLYHEIAGRQARLATPATYGSRERRCRRAAQRGAPRHEIS